MAQMKRKPPQTADTAAETMQADCYLTHTLMLSRVLQNFYGEGLKEHGITPQQASLLTAIVALNGAHPADLARTLEIERSTVSRNLKVLDDLGFIEFEHTPTGRKRRVTPSQKCREAVLAFFPAWDGAQREIRQTIGAERIQLFVDVVRDLVDLSHSE